MNKPRQQDSTATGKIDCSLLEAEISFWQEMIKFRDASMTDESLERMQQALALARVRLTEATEINSSQVNGATGNVYFMNGRRN